MIVSYDQPPPRIRPPQDEEMREDDRQIHSHQAFRRSIPFYPPAPYNQRFRDDHTPAPSVHFRYRPHYERFAASERIPVMSEFPNVMPDVISEVNRGFPGESVAERDSGEENQGAGGNRIRSGGGGSGRRVMRYTEQHEPQSTSPPSYGQREDDGHIESSSSSSKSDGDPFPADDKFLTFNDYPDFLREIYQKHHRRPSSSSPSHQIKSLSSYSNKYPEHQHHHHQD